MPTYVETWDEGAPAGTEAKSLGDDRIRALKRALRERLAEDHDFRSDETGITTIGYHNKITGISQTDNPASVSGASILYTKTVAGVVEWLWKDSAGTVRQLTSAGSILLTATEAVLLTGDQTIAGIKTFTSIPIGPDANPTADNELARKKYVDDKTWPASALTSVLGAWGTAVQNAPTLAATDLLIVGYCSGDGRSCQCRTDSANPPTTLRAWTYSTSVGGNQSFFMPVKKGHYYLLTATAGVTAYAIPIGS